LLIPEGVTRSEKALKKDVLPDEFGCSITFKPGRISVSI
jgi:hypothetical protein